MGNRAVIAMGDVTSANTIGIYVHWNGGRDSVEGFLKAARHIMSGRMGDVVYARARLVEAVGLFFDGNTSVGLGMLDELDTDNYDNGTYQVDMETLEINGRFYFKGAEQLVHDSDEIAQQIIDRVEAYQERESAA